MWGLLALILVVLIMGGCAIVIGSGSATATARVETKREVAPDTATIEDVLIQKEKRK